MGKEHKATDRWCSVDRLTYLVKSYTVAKESMGNDSVLVYPPVAFS